jgi:hypothetical protein
LFYHIILSQNKIDLVKEKEAASQYEEILNFTRGTVADGAPIIPISAQLKYNIDVICEYIVKKIPMPLRDFTSTPHMVVIRSFDVNKPGKFNHACRAFSLCSLISFLTLTYLTLPYITLPYLTLPYLTLPYITLPYLP